MAKFALSVPVFFLTTLFMLPTMLVHRNISTSLVVNSAIIVIHDLLMFYNNHDILITVIVLAYGDELKFQVRATFSERGLNETFQSSSWAGVTNEKSPK